MEDTDKIYPTYASTLEIGRIIGRVEALEKDSAELKRSTRDLDNKLDGFKDLINEIKNTLGNVVTWTKNKDKQEENMQKSLGAYELLIVSSVIGGVMGIVVGVILKFL
jgi:hypothetical protein